MSGDASNNRTGSGVHGLDAQYDDFDENDDEDFVDLQDAVEVEVDDDVPMDDDGEESTDLEEDLEDDDDDDDEEEGTGNQDGPAIVEMAKVILESHADAVYAVASYFDPITSTLFVISGAGDDKAYLHTVADITTSTRLSHNHNDSVSCAAFNMGFVSDNLTQTPLYAAVGAFDGAIIIYDPRTGNKLQELEGPTDVEFISFHPKGGSVLLAGSGQDGSVWMYHLPTQKCLQVFVGHESGVTAGAFTPDGKWALSASTDGTLRVWAPRTGVSKHVFRLASHNGGPDGLTCLAVGGGVDGKLVMVGGEDGSAHVCHVGTKKVVETLRHVELPSQGLENDNVDAEIPLSVEAVGFASPAVNPNWCATGGVDGILKIWDLTNGHCRQVCCDRSEHVKEGGITRLQWHPTLPLVFTASSDGIIRIWDARNGNLVSALTGHSDVINDLSVVSLDNGQKAVIVSGSDDNTVRVFEIDVAAAIRS